MLWSVPLEPPSRNEAKYNTVVCTIRKRIHYNTSPQKCISRYMHRNFSTIRLCSSIPYRRFKSFISTAVSLSGWRGHGQWECMRQVAFKCSVVESKKWDYSIIWEGEIRWTETKDRNQDDDMVGMCAANHAQIHAHVTECCYASLPLCV